MHGGGGGLYSFIFLFLKKTSILPKVKFPPQNYHKNAFDKHDKTILDTSPKMT